MQNIFGMLKDAHRLKREMGRVSEGLAALETEGVAGKGRVRVAMDGQMKLKRVTIAPELLARGDAAALGELVVAAANQARENAQKLAAEAMRKMAGVPGGME
jgi:nucleoid-associated protein EbfC